MEKVRSSVITGAEYDHDKRQMTLQFHGGRKYLYHDVDYADYRDLMAAESVGRHFGQFISGKFKSERIEPEGEKVEEPAEE